MPEIRHTVRSKRTQRQSSFGASVVNEDEFKTVVSDINDADLSDTLREVIYAYDSNLIKTMPENKGEDDLDA